LYQFLSFPLTNKEFIDGSPASMKTVFHYSDTLKQHSQLSASQQIAAELRRMEAAGIQIDLLLNRQQFLKSALLSTASKDVFDEGGKAYATAMNLYKEYISHKNKQFSTIGDTELRKMMDSIEYTIKLSRSLLLEAVPKTDQQRQARANNVSNVDRFWLQLTKEKQFVQQYLATAEAGRKQLFMKR
jgi:hypothetical protein